MVLARKKLKQKPKLLTLLPAGDGEAGVVKEAQTIKERLDSSKRPRPKSPKKPSPRKPRVTKVEAAALRQQAEAEWRKEVERRREERRKEKKEKRKIRRLMEAEAAETLKLETEAENQKFEVADPAAGSDDPLVAEDSEQSLKTVKVEAGEKKQTLGMAGPAVGSNNLIVAEDSEQSINKVFVGGIPYYSSEDDIRSFFEGCGSITALDCMTFPETGKFRGIAILTFKTDTAAQRALALDGADMGGFYLKIQPYKYNREKEDFAPKMIEGYNRIYVGNLAWDITEDDIKKFFSDCKISSVRFGTDKETGDFKGYAHVDFSDGTSLAVAMKLDQKVIKGRSVRIRCAVPKKDNQKLNDNANLYSSKNKICTCYECGTPGHLSSSCPNKKASEVISDENKANIDSATASLKKRRTCYDCGVPGHLSSACPNKKAAEAVSNNEEPDDEPKSAPSIVSEENKISDELNSAPLKKRRKCYECGISGHLSSACPNKKATQINSDEKKPDGGSSTPLPLSDGKKASDNTNSVPPKKKKRRTCYECGIAGHLSSECPNKAAAEAK